MNDERSRSEELAEIAALPPADPRRQAFERSPGGRAMLASYRSFLDPGEVPSGARPDEAEARLAERLESELRRGATRDTPARDAARGAGTWAAIQRALAAPALRPAYALAAVTVVAGTIWLALPRPVERAPRMRGSIVGREGSAAPSLVAYRPRTLAGGEVELGWPRVPGADRYEVTFMTTDLSEIGAPRVVHEPLLVLRRDALPGGLAHGSTVLWQVSARHGNDVLASSHTGSLRLP
jgi:hypothetical protein